MRLTTLRMAWRNLGRSRKRTALAVSAIAVGQFALLAMSGLMHGYVDQIRLAVTGPMIGHVQVHAPDWRRERAADLVLENVGDLDDDIRRQPGVMNAAARIYAPALVAPAEEAHAAMVVGVEADVESQVYGLLSGLREPLEKGKVLAGHILARKTGIKPGARVAVVSQGADGSIANDLYEVQDVIRCPSDLVNQAGVVMRLEDAQALLAMPDEAHEIVVRADRSGQAEALAQRLSQRPALAGTEVLPWSKIVPEFVLLMDMSDYAAYFILILVFVAAIAGIMNTLMMSTFERMHEFGMLLALGSKPTRLVRMVVAEAVLLGLAGVAVGTVLGYLFTLATSGGGIDMAAWTSTGEARDVAFKGLNLPLHVYPRLEAMDTTVGVAAVMLTSLLASIWPALVAARLQPTEAMRA